MKIKSFQGGFDNNLSHLIWCEITKKAGIVDTSVNTTSINKFIKKHELILEKVLITHTHPDHIYFLDDILNKFPHIQIYGFEKPENKLCKNYRGLKHHEIITLGSEFIASLYTPGHYPDSLCYWNKRAQCIFTGDTMFVGRTGRTVDKKSNIVHLYHSIYDQILKLPKETIIYPGHHYGYTPSITLEENIISSIFFQYSSESEFVRVMENYENSR
ncbi:uncharacterized protein METZ01_LOCUS341364 [marine metagenome]|uniref:Metallo-beta-lactamase domain-containing protein n=1 Tax=marine metagenome TaxID=408172 RepID=A0A382QUD4_9ZZZZ